MIVQRLLFVDDRSKRIHAALRKYSPEFGFEITVATNFHEAMRLLSGRDFDIVSLDHDLNGCDFEDPDSPACGMEIVRYIEKTGWPEGKHKPSFWIHSKNLFAAHLMVRRLLALGLEAAYKPFEYEQVEHMKYDKEGLPCA